MKIKYGRGQSISIIFSIFLFLLKNISIIMLWNQLLKIAHNK